MDTADAPDQDEKTEHVVELLRHSRIAMLTYLDSAGGMLSKPMATQDVDFDGTLRFVAQRDSDKVQALLADPRVNVSYSNNGSWVSVAGQARIVDDAGKLEELWDSFTGSWLDGGPDDPNNILIEVDADTAEYWDAPGGSRLVNLANLVKAKLTGDTIDGDNETVQL